MLLEHKDHGAFLSVSLVTSTMDDTQLALNLLTEVTPAYLQKTGALG